MVEFDPDVHHRRSIRLPEFDYSQAGSYFVTICTRDHACVFGVVDGDAVVLGAAGNVVAEEMSRVEDRFPGVLVEAVVIMPNHVHAIIVIEDQSPAAGLGVMNHALTDVRRGPVGAQFIAPGHQRDARSDVTNSAATLGKIVRAFKASSARTIRRDLDPDFGWQRNYYERVIRNERELRTFHEYILTNPARWVTDDLFSAVPNSKGDE